MRTYIVKRLLLIVPTLLGAATLVFLIMRVIPGDVALLIFGGDAAGHIDPKQLAAMRERLGLNDPLWMQFGTWLWGVLRFDFGTSLWTGQPVIEELLIRLPLSLELALFATLVSVIIAIPLGMLAAVRQDTWIDYAVRIFSIGGLAIPGFWVGILTILALVIFFGWGPPLEFTPPWVDPWANFSMMVWPIVTVGYRFSAVTTRMTRSTVLEVLREDYIRTAWAKGLGGAGRRDPPRPQERDASGHHADRHGVRLPDRRPRRHGDGLHAERHRAVRGGRRRPPRLPGRAGPHLPDRVQLRDRQPPRRPDLRVVRSTHPVPLAMATNIELTHAEATATLAPKLSIVEAVVKFARTKPLGAAGGAIIVLMLVVAASAELLAPYDAYRADYGAQFARPSAEHWFGTDEFGRDLMSRIMYGAQDRALRRLHRVLHRVHDRRSARRHERVPGRESAISSSSG